MLFKLYFLSNRKLCCHSYKTGKIISFSRRPPFLSVAFALTLAIVSRRAHKFVCIGKTMSTFIAIITVQYSIRSSLSLSQRLFIYLYVFFFCAAVVTSIENRYVPVTLRKFTYGSICFRGTSNGSHWASKWDIHVRFMSSICLSARFGHHHGCESLYSCSC